MSEHSFIDIDNLKFHCHLTKTSTDKPWLVFGNSLLTDLSIWSEQVSAFSTSHNILCFDQRGHGKTSVPNDLPTMDVLSKDLLQLMDHFGIKTCTYVGLSMGVPTGLGAYKMQPHRFTALVLSDGLAKPSPTGIATWSERLKEVQNGSMSAYVDETISRWFSPEFFVQNRTRADDFKRMMKQTTVAGFAAGVNALQNFDHAELLGEIVVPVLTLAGQDDGAMPAIMEKMADSIPRARFFPIAGAGHIPNVANPDGFNSKLQQFLTKNSSISA